MKKQKAVDYFFSQLTVIPFIEKMEMKGIFIPLEKYHDILEKAQAIEREQIRESYIAGFSERDDINKRLYFNSLAMTYNERIFNEWHNQTYGSK